jgi:hypothetical protein
MSVSEVTCTAVTLEAPMCLGLRSHALFTGRVLEECFCPYESMGLADFDSHANGCIWSPVRLLSIPVIGNPLEMLERGIDPPHVFSCLCGTQISYNDVGGREGPQIDSAAVSLCTGLFT